MFHLQGAPMRRPYSDWIADVDRLLERKTGCSHEACEDYPWEAEYDCGISPREAVDNWIADR